MLHSVVNESMYIYSKPRWYKPEGIGAYSNSLEVNIFLSQVKYMDILVFSMTVVKITFAGENVKE